MRLESPNDLATVMLRSVANQLSLLPTFLLEKHVEKCRASIDRADSFGCFLDPTGYRDAMESGQLEFARQQLEVAKHLLAARRAMDKLQEQARKPTD